MAEQVEKEYIDKSILCEWDNLMIEDENGELYSIYDIGELPNADVVERDKYDNLHNLAKSWLEEKKELEKANSELRSKIDKAIKEISKLPTWSGNLDVSPNYVIEIIKRNIGE